MPPLVQNITINYKGLVSSVALAIQLAPSAAWGESLHVSGLFGVLVKDLIDDKVSYSSPCLEDGASLLTGLRSFRRSSS